MNVLDLFSGIGGFSLGLERAGMRTVMFCEIDPYCRSVLAKHWPHVPCYPDIRELTAAYITNGGRRSIDVICGGFPCQDISVAGKGAGIDGERSGLWSEYARIIGEVRPRYVIVENVAALLGRGLDRVLGDLAALGFDAEWHCIPASAVGAPHRRDRLWLVAYPHGEPVRGVGHSGATGSPREMQGETEQRKRVRANASASSGSQEFSDTDRPRLSVWLKGALGTSARHAESERQDCPGREWWAVEPDVGRVAHGVSARVDRLRALGNAVVPQIPEIIGRAIMSAAQ